MFVLSCELNEQVQTCADKIGPFKSGRVACTGNKPANCDEGKKNQHRLIRLIKTYFYLYAQVISEVWNSDPLFCKSLRYPQKRPRFLKIICVGFPCFIMCISRRKNSNKNYGLLHWLTMKHCNNFLMIIHVHARVNYYPNFSIYPRFTINGTDTQDRIQKCSM